MLEWRLAADQGATLRRALVCLVDMVCPCVLLEPIVGQWVALCHAREGHETARLNRLSLVVHDDAAGGG
eukprot:5870275-Prymnesium_polylepis.1